MRLRLANPPSGTERTAPPTSSAPQVWAAFKSRNLIQRPNLGPNIAVTGEGLEQSSGRAINLLQQAGLADLGPFIQSYRGWKIRLYRAVWNTVQRVWEAERWIRVTDDEDLAQFIQVNGVLTNSIL